MDTDFYVQLLDQVADGVYFVDTDRRITFWNHGAERITGYAAEEVLGHSCSEGILRHVNDNGTQLCLHGCPLAAVMKDGRNREASVFMHHKDGHRVPISVKARAMHDDDGAVFGSVEVFSSQVRNPFVDLLSSDADDAVDPITGLPTRRFGDVHLRSLAGAVNEGTASLGLLFIDVDRFKSVNDTHGHIAGDEVLHMVGQSVANALGRQDVPLRWGGEEFVVMMPGVDQDGLAKTAERVRMLIENSWLQRGDLQLSVTVSIGATMMVPGEGPAELVDRADRLMYSSKAAGRNHVTTDSGTLTRHAERPLRGTAIPWLMSSAAT